MREVVESEMADVCAAVSIHDHIVALVLGNAAHVGMLHKSIGFEPEQPSVRHRDRKQSAVGEPADA